MLGLHPVLLLGGALVVLNNGGAALEESFSKDVLSESRPVEKTATAILKDENLGDSKSSPSIETKPIDTPPKVPKKDTQKQNDWPFFPYFDPNLFFNPYFNQISAAVFTRMVDQYKNDLDMIRHRQNLVLKYAECSCPDAEKCPKVDKPDATEDIRNINYYNWGYNRPEVEYVTSERFYAVMNSLQKSIEKLTLRQNTLYEYVECSCTAKSECRESIKPVLEVMFSNNGNTTGQLIQSLFVPGSIYNPASNFFQTLASYFTQIPSWFAYNFNPLAAILSSAEAYAGGYPSFLTNPVSTPSVPPSTSASSSSSSASSTSSAVPSSTSSSPTSTSTSTTTSTPVSSNYWGGYASGSQPVYSSSSSYSSTSGSGQHVSGGYVSTGGAGQPVHEQYAVSTNGEPIHLSSSTGGSGLKSPSGRSLRYVYGPGYGVNPGIAAAGIGVNAGLQAMQASLAASRPGLGVAGFYGNGVPVPYYLQ